MPAPKVLGFSGSTREGSFNRKLLKIALAGAQAAGAEITYVDLKELALPMFDEDLEKASGAPAGATRLKQLMMSHDGLLIASPEYNSSVSGALKNAIDWASRPAPGEASLAAFNNKVCAVMACSPGALGGLRGLVHLRAILGNINVIMLPQQVAVMKAHEAFDDAGNLKDAKQQASAENLGKLVTQVVTKLKA